MVPVPQQISFDAQSAVTAQRRSVPPVQLFELWQVAVVPVNPVAMQQVSPLWQ
jgi:hypothetical protein